MFEDLTPQLVMRHQKSVEELRAMIQAGANKNQLQGSKAGIEVIEEMLLVERHFQWITGC